MNAWLRKIRRKRLERIEERRVTEWKLYQRTGEVVGVENTNPNCYGGERMGEWVRWRER